MAVEIKELLSPADIIVGLRASNKRAALQTLARHMASTLTLSPDEVFAAILKREELGSTGVGNGVALPHARLNALQRPAGVLARLKHPIPFDAIDGHQVDVVALLLLPANAQGGPLNALACAARTLRDANVLSKVRQAADRNAVYVALTAPAG